MEVLGDDLRQRGRANLGAARGTDPAFDAAAQALAPLQIGDWRVDRSTNEISRAGTVVRIEPKAMEVLGVLAERAGQAVSREQLLDAVWPGVVVGDEALTQSIIKLRKALGDNSRQPSYIETISKRGYRLIAPVGTCERLSAVASRRPRSRWLGAAVLLGLAGAGAYVLGSHGLGPRIAPAGPGGFEAGQGERDALVTLTVLPFEALGAGADEAYLARGIGSDLVTDLSRVSRWRLISSPASPSNNAQASAARYVVAGSVQRDGATLRINIRLVDALTGEQLWSQRFEQPLGNLFPLQTEISRSLAEHLPGKISDAERQRLAKRYTHSLQAYDDFLRAQALFLVRRPEENRQARAFYKQAIELDPKFARAYAGLAMTYAMDHRYETSTEPAAGFVRALELAETARQIDPDTPDVYWVLGFVHTQRRRHEQAIQALRKAIELNPSYADAYALMGGIYTYIGEPGKTIPLLRAALRLHPDGGYLYFLLLGRAYLFENDAEQALINLRESLARNPDNLEARVYLAAALTADGQLAEARWQADEIRAREAGFTAPKWLATYPMTSARHQEMLVALLATAGL